VATKLNSTRSTSLKVDNVDRVALAPYKLATKSKGRSTFGRQSRPYWRQSRPYWWQCRPRQAFELKLLPICRQNRRQSRPLSPVCTGLYTASSGKAIGLSRSKNSHASCYVVSFALSSGLVRTFKLVTEDKHCMRQFVLQAGPNAILYGYLL